MTAGPGLARISHQGVEKGPPLRHKGSANLIAMSGSLSHQPGRRATGGGAERPVPRYSDERKKAMLGKLVPPYVSLDCLTAPNACR
jgi:hypothetical protein